MREKDWIKIRCGSECDIPVPGILLLFGWYRYRYRKNLVPEKSTGTGTEKIWSRKKVPVPVPKKFGPGKKYRYRYRKNLVPEKSTGPGTGKNWSRKKVPVPVSEKIGPGTVEFPGTPGHCIF